MLAELGPGKCYDEVNESLRLLLILFVTKLLSTEGVFLSQQMSGAAILIHPQIVSGLSPHPTPTPHILFGT